jgi:hypothetical protein
MELKKGTEITEPEIKKLECNRKLNSIRKSFALLTGKKYVIKPVYSYSSLTNNKNKNNNNTTRKLPNNNYNNNNNNNNYNNYNNYSNYNNNNYNNYNNNFTRRNYR